MRKRSSRSLVPKCRSTPSISLFLFALASSRIINPRRRPPLLTIHHLNDTVGPRGRRGVCARNQGGAVVALCVRFVEPVSCKCERVVGRGVQDRRGVGTVEGARKRSPRHEPRYRSAF